MLAAAAVLAALGDHWWIADLFGHFRFAYLSGAVLLFALALVVRPRWRALLVVAAAAPHAWTLFAYPAAPAAAPDATAATRTQTLRVVTLNVLYTNNRIGDVIGWLRQQRADVICLPEAIYFRARLIAAFRDSHPHTGPGASRSDTLLLSRHPIIGQRFELPDEFLRRQGRAARPGGYPFHTARLRTPAGPVTVLCIHPFPPLRRSLAAAQQSLFDAIALTARQAGEPVVVAGDFNSTPYARRFRSLLHRGRLKAVDLGWRWPATWPAGGLRRWIGIPLPGLPIDHVLVSSHFRVAAGRIGPAIGGDHHAVTADLVLTLPR